MSTLNLAKRGNKKYKITFIAEVKDIGSKISFKNAQKFIASITHLKNHEKLKRLYEGRTKLSRIL